LMPWCFGRDTAQIMMRLLLDFSIHSRALYT